MVLLIWLLDIKHYGLLLVFLLLYQLQFSSSQEIPFSCHFIPNSATLFYILLKVINMSQKGHYYNAK